MPPELFGVGTCIVWSETSYHHFQLTNNGHSVLWCWSIEYVIFCIANRSVSDLEIDFCKASKSKVIIRLPISIVTIAA